MRFSLMALGAAVVFWTPFSSTAMAQTDRTDNDLDLAGLVIEATVGWDGVVDRSAPVPVSFLISNYSERFIEGHLVLFDPIHGHEVALGEIVVSPGATRRLSSIQDLSEWNTCFAALKDGAQVHWRRELPLSSGSAFVPYVNYALFIDESGRELRLPGAISDGAAIAATDGGVAGKQGNPVQCLSVKTWQVPNHSGPLVVAQAIIFPEGAAEPGLNRLQWRAVAEWICQGGTVFLHKDSRESIDRLTKSAPLGKAAPEQLGEFTVHRVGLGAIYEYPRPLFASEGGKIRQLLVDTTAKLTKSHAGTLGGMRIHHRKSGRADSNRLLVVAFFGCYMLLSGLVAMLLFRLSRRRIGAYIVVVVVGASVLSGLLGGFLRFSQGDLRWMTVTQAGTGGIVQVGGIDVQSAGGRNTQVTIKGENADLQIIGRSRHYDYYNYGRFYSRNQWQTGYVPFTWQPNLVNGEDDVYQINVPMTPWGRRHLHATAFQRDLPRLDFELEFEPRDSPGSSEGKQTQFPGAPSGIFTLKLANRLPFDITNCRLLIGVTHKSAAQAGSQQITPAQAAERGRLRQRASSRQTVLPNVDGLIDVYHQKQLPTLTTGTTLDDAFEANFQLVRNNQNLIRSWPGGWLTHPRISRLGTASAWIVGLISESPIMTIDEQRSDFVPQEEFHLFIQEILPEDMPDASLFLGSGDASANEPAKK